MREKIIAGNWKMYKTTEAVESFIAATKGNVPSIEAGVSIICVPFPYLALAQKLTAGTNLKVAAQNMHYETEGAFTGEVSPLMLQDLAVPYVVLGHSERRAMFNETDESVNKKAHAAFAHDILPIICVGESLEERENGTTNEIVSNQTLKALEGLNDEQIANTVIAYEPIWAIGTGKTATSDQAQETIKVIRDAIATAYSQTVADVVRIQYGGSVKPDNIEELLSKEDIDGALVGGASLQPDSFLALLSALK